MLTILSKRKVQVKNREETDEQEVQGGGGGGSLARWRAKDHNDAHLHDFAFFEQSIISTFWDRLKHVQ